MSITDAIFTIDFLVAVGVYAVMTPVCLYIFLHVHHALEHPFLLWQWDNIAGPLLKAGLMLVFITLLYPSLFGLQDAPTLASLHASDETRVHSMLNLLFLITLLFPLIPIIGKFDQLILPLQGIAATTLLFSWLAAALQLDNISYWPGLNVLLVLVVIAFISHFLSLKIAQVLGDYLDEQFTVKHSADLVAKGILIFMQGPIILIFGLALGKQI